MIRMMITTARLVTKMLLNTMEGKCLFFTPCWCRIATSVRSEVRLSIENGLSCCNPTIDQRINYLIKIKSVKTMKDVCECTINKVDHNFVY